MAQKENNFQQDEHDKVKDFQGAGHNLNPIKTTAQTMKDEQYIKERIDDQINYFGIKASKAQKKYKKLKRWEIFIAATIPVLIAFSALSILENTVFKSNLVIVNGVKMLNPIFSLSTVFQIIAAIGGIIIVFLKSVVDLEDYYKTWKEFRSVEMTLQQEKYKFVTRTEPYDESDAYSILVEEVELILNKENQKWRSVKKPSNDLTKKAEEALFLEFNRQRKESEISEPITQPITKKVVKNNLKKNIEIDKGKIEDDGSIG